MLQKVRTWGGTVLATAVLAAMPIACGDRSDQGTQDPSQDPNAPFGTSRDESQGGAGTGERSRQATSTAQGELTSVDTGARTMTVRTQTGTMNFRYDDQTRITGAQTSPAGLATMSGAQVTVQYRSEGTENMATMVDIK